jgi:RNA polymerase sigma-B factor
MATSTSREPERSTSDELLRRFEEYRRTGDRTLRNSLIEQHRPLAISLARRFANRGEPFDDLVQVALLATLKAVERFDPVRGVSFASFATPTILGEIKRHFRDTSWGVHVRRRAQELHLRIPPVVEQFVQRHARRPTVLELAAELECLEDDVLEALEAGAAYRPVTLSPASDGRPRPPEPRVAEPGYDAVDHRSLLDDLLGRLPEHQRVVVHLRFVDELTQTEIAHRLGLTQMQVSRLLRRSVTAMRQRAAHQLAL